MLTITQQDLDDLEIEVKSLRKVLEKILAAHEIGDVDWSAMREAKSLLVYGGKEAK